MLLRPSPSFWFSLAQRSRLSNKKAEGKLVLAVLKDSRGEAHTEASLNSIEDELLAELLIQQE